MNRIQNLLTLLFNARQLHKSSSAIVLFLFNVNLQFFLPVQNRIEFGWLSEFGWFCETDWIYFVKFSSI